MMTNNKLRLVQQLGAYSLNVIYTRLWPKNAFAFKMLQPPKVCTEPLYTMRFGVCIFFLSIIAFTLYILNVWWLQTICFDIIFVYSCEHIFLKSKLSKESDMITNFCQHVDSTKTDSQSINFLIDFSITSHLLWCRICIRSINVVVS